MIIDNNLKAFLELVRAGLWEKEARLSPIRKVDYEEVMRLAEEQSVDGLVTAGLEHVSDVKVSQDIKLQFIGQAFQIEQWNMDMNAFVAKLIEKLRSANVYGLLVKGQGVAQCYEKPLWRTAGDIDLLLSEENYKKAKVVLTSIADEVERENKLTKHQAFVIKGFDVELHGGMPFMMSRRVDKVIDEVLRDCFNGGIVISWRNGNTTIFLPTHDIHVILVFTHLLHHFFIEGVGLRQICDWCRLLWCHRTELDLRLLERRIRTMGLMTEWKAFGTMAVVYLGMPVEAMPFLNERCMKEDGRWKKKAERVLKRVMKSGNFGHKNDLSYRAKYSGLTYKMVATWRRFVDFASLLSVFPVDAPRFFVTYVLGKVR